MKVLLSLFLLCGLSAPAQAQNARAICFNVDQEIGKVEPFIKQEKYTFPVLLAHDYVNDLLAGIAIPQVWVVDINGKWLWEKVGFDSGRGGWRENVLAKIGQQ
jgi:hypothetical protein